MVKRVNDSTGEDSISESPSKRHKKHKKHKHKKRLENDEESLDEETHIKNKASSKKEEDIKPIKLKIKIGDKGQDSGDGAGASQLSNEKRDKKKKDKSGEMSSVWKAKDDVFRTRKSDEDTSDEEKEWLKALEKGTLDDHGMITKEKSEKLMTARQRALLHGKQAEPLMELPSGYKAKELSEEQVKKKQQRAHQRREMAAKKHEKDKKQTLERLLRKQDAKGKGLKGRQHKRSRPPGYRYINGLTSITVSIPEGKHDPYQAQKAQRPPAKILCGVKGCKNLKKYSCSKTGVPLCSLQCYKNNLILSNKGKEGKT